ncbi:MAG: TIGR03089 family protein [Jatrophihabitans sp.]|uniref:TIGR03089 family protein n=1 Tax=Jatrophihabitans sp. TaxID=1932789 RepID=UPI003F7E7330
MTPDTPEGCFAALMARDPSRPFVTHYDEATGGRVELSVKSTANWVAKTHHLLGTELGLSVGDVASVQLPADWLSLPVLLGCLSAGLALTPADDAAASVAFVAPGASASALDVYAVAPQPTGAPDDYIGAVRPQADAWASVQSPAGPDDPCLPGLTRGEVVARARVRASELGLDDGARVLTTRAWTSADDWIDTVVAPLVVGGSLVLLTGPADDALVARRVGQERATVVVH